MAHAVIPEFHVIAETKTLATGISRMLWTLKAPDWQSQGEVNDAEMLTEIAGRLCYRSFNTEVNLNVNRIREDRGDYINNILRQRHGSVLEHTYTTVAFLNVSRVFTHELVRHRLGGISQESMRYVRLEDLPFVIPGSVTKLEDDVKNDVVSAMKRIFDNAEDVVRNVGNLLSLNTMDFEGKKHWTSFLRRLIPNGIATNIIYTTNHRQWRHIIQNRSAKGAEEEIRKVFIDLGSDFISRYPQLYQDFDLSDDGSWVATNGRI
jgi:thymidylate synthase (FAD)